LLPIALTLFFWRHTLRARDADRRTVWADYRGFGRFILAATVAGWWIEWDFRGRSELPPILARNWPGTFGTSSAEILLFWVPPVASLAVFLFSCYAIDRTFLKQRWSSFEMVRRTWWRLVSFVVPLQMVAAGFTAIFEGKISGTAWLLSAGVVSRIGTGFLRRAEGVKLNRLKSGELRNRAFKMAGQMGVTLQRVYMVPAGKGHLANAYGMSHAIGLTDSLGKYLTKAQMDYVIGHELAHVKLKHNRKHLFMVLGIFSTMTVLLFRFSRYALPLHALAQIAVIFVPLAVIYYFSREWEYSADRVAVEFTGAPEVAIRGLVNLHKVHEVPMQTAKFSEFFMTHPSLARRVAAIARIGQIPAQELSRILDDGVYLKSQRETSLRN
ncbi:MAG TPA: M48 family metallopeptidase, partial [Candidatus Acidoferrum sp.]|nr:M48 family metallopeptidase [Candidatus Acidoferrum sp.]